MLPEFKVCVAYKREGSDRYCREGVQRVRLCLLGKVKTWFAERVFKECAVCI